jgi:hypothetical protein
MRKKVIWFEVLDCVLFRQRRRQRCCETEQVKDEIGGSVPHKIRVVKFGLWWCMWIDGWQTDRLTDLATDTVVYDLTNKHTQKFIKLQDVLIWQLSFFFTEEFTKTLILVFSSSVQFLGTYYFTYRVYQLLLIQTACHMFLMGHYSNLFCHVSPIIQVPLNVIPLRPDSNLSHVFAHLHTLFKFIS